MSDKASNNKRIAKNTLVLYFRMIFLMVISLYTSRVILDALGVEDYGIYNVVGGFVALFGLISAALTSACSRFLNFEMGKGDVQRQNVVFSTALTIQWTLAIIVFLIAEIIGVWYVNNVMVMPAERLTAANWCFQFSVFNFCMNIITVPYNASIIAHEKMKTFAYVSLYEGVSKLIISFLVYYEPFDRLVFYALMLLIIQFTVRYTYQAYCRKHFEECHYKRVFDKPLLRNMLSYSLWHLAGNGAPLLKNQGVNMVLNLFFGPTVNAARGIANHVEGAVHQFSSNFIIAINPQITQSYASGNMPYMFELVEKGTRFSFYLLFVITLPLLSYTDTILHVWLKDVPDYTLIFTQLTLIMMLVRALSRPMIIAQNATGNVRNFQLTIGFIIMLNLPLSYVFLKLGFGAEIVVVIALIIEIIALFVRIFMLKSTIPQFEPLNFITRILWNCCKVAFIPLLLMLIFTVFIRHTIAIDFLFMLLCIFICTTSVITIGCTKTERIYIVNKTRGILNKLRK